MGKATFFSRYLNSLTINALVACCGWWFFDFATRFTILPKTKSGISSENMPRPSFSVSPIRCLRTGIGQWLMGICNRIGSRISTVVFSVLSRRAQTHATDQCRYFPQDFRTINLASYDKGSRGNGWGVGYAPAWLGKGLPRFLSRGWWMVDRNTGRTVQSTSRRTWFIVLGHRFKTGYFFDLNANYFYDFNVETELELCNRYLFARKVFTTL